MKNIILLITGLFLFTACSKNDDLQQEDTALQEEVVNLKFVKDVETSTGEEQKVLYSLLNKNEKAFIWNSKMQKLIESKNISDRQRNIIAEVQLLLTAQLFDEENENRDTLLENIMNWFETYSSDFSSKEIYYFFGSVGNQQIFSKSSLNPEEITISDELGGDSCNCSTNVIDCPFFSSCNTGLNADCDQEQEGCGVFDLFPCRGECSS